MASIVSLGPDRAGKVYPLDGGECLLGRRLDCHVCITDQRVSRRHSRIRREGDGWHVEDLGSCNGTYVNGKRIQGGQKLRHGDEVEIGASRFRVDLTDDMLAAVENAAVVIGDASEALDPLLELPNAPGQWPRDASPAVSAKEVERLQRKLQVLYRVAESLAGTLEPKALMEKVVASLLELFPQASAAAVVVVDARTQQTRTHASRRRRGALRDSQLGVSIPRVVVDRVIRQGHSVLLRAPGENAALGTTDTMVIKNPLRGPALEGAVPPDHMGAVGWRMGSPLMFRGESMGILHVEAEPALGYFTQDDLDLLGGLAAQAGVGLHSLGLHQKLVERQRLDHDLRLARQIQRNLLPRDPPQVQGVDFAVHYEPAFDVGGDFYDFIWHDPTRLSIVVGDVSGKAISGALFMARVTSEIRAVAPVEVTPRRVLARVNRALSEVSEDGMFVTMLYVAADLAQGTVRFSNAGHTTPLLRRGSDVHALEFAEARTMPVGIEARLEVGEAQVKLEPGDLLLLYTDGIIEACSQAGEYYGIERLTAALANSTGGARATLEAVLSDVDRFVEEAAQADDQTVVCISINDLRAASRQSVIPPLPRP